MDVEYYAEPGPLTQLSQEQQGWVNEVGDDPTVLCRVAQGLLVAPGDAFGAGLSEQRMQERNLRPAQALFERAMELDPSVPLGHPRAPQRRVVGTCRHFAVLATSFLRAVGVPARARCGFARYFVPPKSVDHWIVEHWSTDERRWVRVDPEYLDRDTPGPSTPADLRPGEFLAAGEAWQLVRSGRDDPMSYGVFGTDNWGPGEIRGNAMRDLASLAAKIEMLPWDEWGPMADSYAGETGDDFDELIDRASDAMSSADAHEVQRVYAQLIVPPDMVT